MYRYNQTSFSGVALVPMFLGTLHVVHYING